MTHLTPEETKQKYIEAMGEKLGTFFHALWNKVTFLRNPIFWALILTFSVVIIAVLVFKFSENIETAAQTGDFFAGMAGTLAFIWLVAGFMQQSRELGLQREELTLQRHALNQQKEEFKKLSKFAGLEQMRHIIDQFISTIPDRKIEGLNTPSDLISLYINGLSDWKIILESKNQQIVFDTYMRWVKIEATCLGFLGAIVSAANLYAEATGNSYFTKKENDVLTVSINQYFISQIPQLNHYAGLADSLSDMMSLYEPGLKKVKLAGLKAMNEIIPGTVKSEAISELQNYVDEFEKKRKEKNNPD